MRILTARVQGGVIVTEEATDLPEGAAVMVVLAETDGESTFALTPDEKADLLEAIAEADRGEVVPAAEVLERLAR